MRKANPCKFELEGSGDLSGNPEKKTKSLDKKLGKNVQEIVHHN